MMEDTLVLSDLVIMQSCSKAHNVSYIQLKILTTGLLVAKTLIEYNNFDENDEEEKRPIDLEFFE